MENIFGKTLRKLRKQFRMTQKDLANHIGVSEMTIRRFESGERVPKMPTIEALADFFDVTPQYMLFGNDSDDSADDDAVDITTPISIKPKYIGLEKLATNIEQLFEKYFIDGVEAMIPKYTQLNSQGREEVKKHVDYLSTQEKYTTPDAPGHKEDEE